MKKKLITLLPLLILVAACSNGAQSSEEISSSESGSGTSIEITSDTTESVEDSSDSESSSSSSESSEDSSSESSDSYVNAQIQFEIDSSESTSQAMSAESLASYIKTTVYTIKSVETSSVYRAEGTTKALKVSSSKHSGNIDLTFNDTLVVRSVSLYVASYNEKDSSVYVGLNNNDETLKSTQIGSSNDIKKVTYSFDSVEMTTLNITSPSKNQFNLYGIDIDSGPVEPVYATSITLPESMTLTEGSQKTLSPAITPANCNQKSITWTSSDNEVATVTNGLVKALKVGTADITATIKTETDSLSATCALTVEEAPASTKTTLKESYEDYIENNAYALSSCPTTGNPKILIIPIWFTDSSTFISNKDNVRNDIETAYLGSESETGWHSVKSYYYQESEQRLNLEGTVSDWYSVGKSASEFGDESNGADNTSALATTAADWYFNNNPSDSRKNYDTDGDGYLDSVMLIYAAPDYSAYQTYYNNEYYNLWAYCFWVQDTSVKSTSKPGTNVFFWASYDFMYNETTARSRTGKSSYYNGDTSHCTIDAHTYIHEMGHVFGLDDYYDYSSHNYNPAGGFSMQDYNVGGHDPYSVMALGWANPYIPTTSTTIEIGAFQTNHDLILLTPEWNSYDSPFDEYLLLELYTPTGLNELDSTYQYSGNYPQGPKTTGIRLWHVDARLVKFYGESCGSTAYTTTSVGEVYHMMSNTYYSSDVEGYVSPLGSSYANYNILQLIRNNTTATYKPTDDLSASSLFTDGDSFDMSTYGKQFYNTGKLNSNKSLGWSFTVSISGSGETAKATISLVKE